MSKRSILVIFALALALIVFGGVMLLVTEGPARNVGSLAVALASVCSIVGAIGSSFRDARRR